MTSVLNSLTMASSAGAASASSGELDERVVAKAALDAAEDALESLCAMHAGTFVAVEKRGQRMEKSLQEMQATIEAVQKKVQLAQEKVERAQTEDEPKSSSLAFRSNDKDPAVHSLAVLSENHRVRRRTLLQHSALLELLELPSLIDACVRSDLYEEALSIAALANSLERRDDKVVRHVVAQIRSRQEDLRRHLLHRLEGNVTMPDCLEVVTALRRLNSIDLELRSNKMGISNTKNSSNVQDAVEPERLYRAMEVKLQIDFLEARDVWLDSNSSPGMNANKYASLSASAATSSSSSSSEDLLDTIERYRTRVFEVATQFNAIFRANSSTSAILGEDNGSSMTSSADLLSMWTCRRIQAFLQVLQMGISSAAATADASAATASSTSNNALSQQFGAATLRDLMEASIFFASSMGRLGADFTAHVIPTMFEDALVDWIVQHCWVQQGVKPLQEVWNICNQVNLSTPLITSGSGSSSHRSHNSVIVWSNPNAEEVKQMFQDFVVPTDDPNRLLEQPIGPLRVLMQVPPLGRFVNAILLGLNELRRCLLPSALPRLEEALETHILQLLSRDLKALERQLITTGKDKILREVISHEYVPLWNLVVVPFCRASLFTSMGRANRALQEYQSARQAIDQMIGEKEQVEAAQLEKQRQEEESVRAALAEKEKEEAEKAAADESVDEEVPETGEDVPAQHEGGEAEDAVASEEFTDDNKRD